MRAALRRVIIGVLLTGSVLVAGGVAAGAQTASTTSPGVPAAAASRAAPATGDTESSRTVNRIVLALLSLAGLLAVLTVWLWWTSKPKPSHLDGLDAMSSRRWRSAAPNAGRRSSLPCTPGVGTSATRS